MSDVFSNLAAQSLGSRVELQPLIPPLFALVPQLLSEAILSASNDQQAEAAEKAMFSNMPSIVADGLIGATEMGQPSNEVMMTEKRAVLPDLVPSDVSRKAISNLSLRHLLYYQHVMRARTETVLHPSQSSAHAPTVDESLLEGMPSANVAQVNSVADDVSHPSPEYQLLRKADETPLSQSIQSQEATLPNTGNTGIPYSTLGHDNQQPTEENLLRIPTNYEPQHTPSKDHLAMPTGEASHFKYPLPPSDEPAVPLLIQPALPVSSTSLQPETQPEHSINRDDALDQPSSSFVQPQVQQASIPVRRDQLIAPLAYEIALQYHASKPRQHTIADDQPEATPQSLSGLNENTIKPLLGQYSIVKEPELLQASEVAESTSVAQSIREGFIEPGASANLISNSSKQDAQHAPRDYLMEEVHSAKTGGEVPTINITIGRLVVRTTSTAQPTPIQKRVLHPAQSLNAYLKQRERGSR